MDYDAIQEQLIKKYPELANQDLAGLAQGVKEGSLLFGFTKMGLLFGISFNLLGIVYFKIGRKESSISKMVCGGLLLIYPMFVTDTIAIIGVGSVLSLYPFIVKRFK